MVGVGGKRQQVGLREIKAPHLMISISIFGLEVCVSISRLADEQGYSSRLVRAGWQRRDPAAVAAAWGTPAAPWLPATGSGLRPPAQQQLQVRACWPGSYLRREQALNCDAVLDAGAGRALALDGGNLEVVDPVAT